MRGSRRIRRITTKRALGSDGGVGECATAIALGAPIADSMIGLLITALILRITWESWHTVRGHGHH